MSGGGNVLIVGGGVSGLALAHYLVRGGGGAGPRVRLVEAGKRVGGWIRTEQVGLGQHGGGTVAYETGPRSLNRIRGSLTLELCGELGLGDSVIPASISAEKRYIVGRDGFMHDVPSSAIGMLRSEMTRSMIPYLIRDLIHPKPIPRHTDLSINDFFNDRIGPHATSLLLSALSAGIYAGDPNRLSMRSCLPALIDLSEQSGSLMRGLIKTATIRTSVPQTKMSPELTSSLSRIHDRLGRAPIYTIEGGLSTLTEALHTRLRPLIDIQIKQKVVSLCPRTLNVQTSDGGRDRYDHVFWTGSTGSLASALSASSSSSTDFDVQSLQTALGRVQYASVACVTLIWTQAAAVSSPQGFGVLVPGGISAAPPVLGITFDSVTFPTRHAPGTTVMTVMIGGDRDPDLARAPDADLVALAHDAVRHLLGIDRKADFAALNVAVDAIPQFYVGHSDVVQEITAGAARLHPQLHVVGTAMSGVAINDCIRRGSEIGHQFYGDDDHIADRSNVFTPK